MDIKQYNKKEMGAVWKELRLQLLILGSFLGVMWGLVLVDHWVDSFSFAQIGLQPRTLAGIPAAIYFHFLHINFLHMALCTLPFLILGWLVMLRDTRDFWVVTGASMLASGAALWLFGTGELASGMLHVHWVGSGGLIMGFAGCLLARAFFERSWLSMGVALLVLFLYGGSLMTLLNPLTSNAFAAYVAAFVAGGLVTRFMARNFSEKTTRSVTDPL